MAPSGNSRVSQFDLNQSCDWVRLTEHALRDPPRDVERRYCLAEIVERGAGVFVERLRVNLIRNGAAVDVRDSSGHTPLDNAIENENRRLFPSLLRAGAALPAETDDAYLRKVIVAGGFRAYERTHLNALAATFAPKLPRCLPPELVRRIVDYAFHAGDY